MNVVLAMNGTGHAFDRVKRLIDEWENTRSGCLEVFAEWMMSHPGASLDDGLNNMARIGLINDWPNKKDQVHEPR